MFKTARLGGAPGYMASLGLDVPEWMQEENDYSEQAWEV